MMVVERIMMMVRVANVSREVKLRRMRPRGKIEARVDGLVNILDGLHCQTLLIRRRSLHLRLLHVGGRLRI